MTSIYLALRRFVKDDSGQGMVEYGLIIALVAVVAIVGLRAIGVNLDGIFDSIASALTGAS